MRHPTMRNGFSIITAVFTIVLMATVAMLVFSLSGKMVQTTTIQYRTEQAALLARSYTELAVLKVLQHNRSTAGNCTPDFDGVVNNIVPGGSASGATSLNGGGYKIETRIHYLGNGLPCSATRILNGSSIQTDYNTTSAADALAGIVVDVYVRYKDPAMVAAYKDRNGAAPTGNQIPWITHHTRRLLKI